MHEHICCPSCCSQDNQNMFCWGQRSATDTAERLKNKMTEVTPSQVLCPIISVDVYRRKRSILSCVDWLKMFTVILPYSNGLIFIYFNNIVRNISACLQRQCKNIFFCTPNGINRAKAWQGMHGHLIGRPYSIHILMSLWLWGFRAKGAINAAHLSLATRVKKGGRRMAVEALTDADAAALPAGSSFCVEAALGFSLPPIPPSRPPLRLPPSFPVLAPRALLLLSLLLPQLLPACLLHSLSTPRLLCLSSSFSSRLWNFQ